MTMHKRAAILLALLASVEACVAQHVGDFWIGRSSAASGRQLKIATDVGGYDPAPPANLIVLPPTPPSSFFEGWSSDSPGFDRVTTANPPGDTELLEPGANVYLDVLAIDDGLLIVDTPTYAIVDAPGQSVQLGGNQLHKHVIWLIDSTLPEFDASDCVWELTFRLRDAGSTGYAPSVAYTIRFATHVPVPADFNCDGYVDLDDVDLFRVCATGAAVPYAPDNLPAGCSIRMDAADMLASDFDRDHDVDMDDFAVVQRCYRGPGTPGDPACNP